ncbi:MAG: autotransporter-associated beta strand repeat-containing protein [Planctomycetia bacterium]|nr:autotransporter-associated beta strand repeat-containing protein [Planctomycetia bacterium]
MSLSGNNTGGATITGTITGLTLPSGYTWGPTGQVGTVAYGQGNTGSTVTNTGTWIIASGAPTDFYWTGAKADGKWNTASGGTNWATAIAGTPDPGSFAPTTGSKIFFTANGAAASGTTTVEAAYSIDSLNFNSNASGGYTINAGAAGALTLNSATTGIVVNSGVGPTVINVPITLANSQTWTNNSANTLTISGNVGGAFNLTTNGTGTTILSGTNSFVNTTISAGVLQIGTGGATGTLGSGTVIDNASLVFKRNNSLSVSNAISGTGSVTQAGAGGTTTLSGNNTYSGTTTISAGTLIAGDNVASTTVLNSALTADSTTDQFTLSGNTLVNGNKVIFGGTTVPTGLTAGTAYFVRDVSGNTFKVSATSGGSAIDLTSNGTSVVATRPGAFGSTTSAVVLGDANSGGNAISLLTGGAFTVERALTVANQGGGTTIGGNTDNTSTFSGTVTLNKDLTVSQVATTGSNALQLSGGMSAGTAGTKTVTFAGPGTINVATTGISDGSGAVAVHVTGGTVKYSVANSYSGDTTISQGALKLGASNVIANGISKGNVVLNPTSGTATFDLAGFNDTINGLSSSGAGSSVVDNTAAGTSSLLTEGDFDVSSTFGGVIQNSGAAATLALTKVGAGTLTLTGTNTYTGATNVNAGKLVVNGSLAAGSTVTVAATATLGGTGTIGGNAVIKGIHNPGNSPGIQTFAGNLTYNGGASVVNWDLNNNTVVNQPNPSAVFDTIVVGGDLSFVDPTTLNLHFNGAGSAVDWSDAFWGISHMGTNGWLVYDVAGNTTGFDKLGLVTTDWLDGQGDSFSGAVIPGSGFFITQEGNDIYLNYSAAPEPGTFVLALFGLATVGFVGWRKVRRPRV